MRILIVDDEPHVTRVLSLCLTRAGYDVDHAPDGAAALEKIGARPPDFLITDVNMPGMGGEQLCRAIHAQYPDRRFPILVMTSMTARENREWASKIPNTEFLEKPLSPRSLIDRLGAHAAEKRGD
jgi:DNA-binding response OmpR family regulator